MVVRMYMGYDGEVILLVGIGAEEVVGRLLAWSVDAGGSIAMRRIRIAQNDKDGGVVFSGFWLFDPPC